MIKYWICTTIPLIFMLLYNGKQGPKLKYFYYWFYPVHQLLFYIFSPFTQVAFINWINTFQI